MSDIPLAARRRRAPVPASLHSHYEWLLTRTGQPPARLLDVGAGDGHLLQVAGQLGTRHLVGIDRKRRWRPPAPATFSAAIADGQHLPFPTDAFDCVLETESLEWIKNPVRYFREAARTCAPTGLVISADSDWDTVVYAVSDTTRARHILRTFCDTGPNGWIGRAAPSLMRRAGLATSRSTSASSSNANSDPTPSATARPRSSTSGSAPSRQSTQLDEFQADLQHTAHRGDYLFSVNRYVCVGRPTQPL